MTSMLSERIKRLIESQSEPPWFPTLTEELVKAGRQQLLESTGISPVDYGTARVMAGSSKASLKVAGYLFASVSDGRSGKGIQVEILEQSFASRYEEAGIRFYTAGEIDSLNLLGRLEDTFSILKQVSTLFESVASLVRSIHLIKPEDDEYDVSFTEPYVPFSIFISVPQVNMAINVLRVAEAIVHEAMHLQLTLIETIVTLGIPTLNKYFSPWRNEYRTAQGVLHALYVFKVIDGLLEGLQPYSCSMEEILYIKSRRVQINKQIRELESFQFCPELTLEGKHLVARLLLSKKA